MNRNIYKIGFFVLLAINMAFVSFIVLKPKRGFKREDMRERLSKELGLSAEQKSLFMDMAKAHREKIRALDANEAELIKSYFSFVTSPDSTNNKVAILAEIQALKAQKIETTYKHFESLREICNEDQQVQFEQFMDRVVPMISGNHRRTMRKPK